MAKKGKIKVKKSAQLRKKGEQPKDTIPRMQAQSPRNNGAVMRIKLKKR